MTLLLVDGSNIVMRAAFGGDIAPEHSVPTAVGMIEKAAREVEATHLVVALDCPGETPNWRKVLFPEYKAHRTFDTSPWLVAAWQEWSRIGWYVENQAGYEADDLIATVAERAKERAEVFVMSSDSDLLTLTGNGVTVLRPQKGGTLAPFNANAVCVKYNIAAPALLYDVKAMAGESGDNLPGCDGIGKVRAAHLLNTYKSLEAIIEAGKAKKCNFSEVVAAHEAVVRLSRKLVQLDSQAPIPPIHPKACKL